MKTKIKRTKVKPGKPDFMPIYLTQQLEAPVDITYSETGFIADRKKIHLPSDAILFVPTDYVNFINRQELDNGMLQPIPDGSHLRFNGANGVIHYVNLPHDSLISII